MIPQANITAWRVVAPWPDDAQIEQDLALSRAVVELFATESLAGRVALRGGTAINKLFIRPANRYSEDIDLVQTQPGPIGPILDAIRWRLDPWLGEPTRSRAQFEQNLSEKQDDRAFLDDIKPLLGADVHYDSRAAMAIVREALVERLPGKPWRGVGDSSDGGGARERRSE